MRGMDTLDTALAQLAASGLIRPGAESADGSYLFRHGLVQDVAYQSLLRADRRRLHRVIGEVLAAEDSGPGDDLALLLAHHFTAADEAGRALPYTIRAAAAAAGKFANDEAAALYATALTLARQAGAAVSVQIDLARARGRALELAARYPEALAQYAALEAEAAPALELAGVLGRAVLHATPTPYNDPARGQAACARALTLARQIGDRAAEAQVLWILLLLYGYEGRDLPQALAYGEQSLAIARELGLPEQM